MPSVSLRDMSLSPKHTDSGRIPSAVICSMDQDTLPPCEYHAEYFHCPKNPLGCLRQTYPLPDGH